jgi:ribonuclease G
MKEVLMELTNPPALIGVVEDGRLAELYVDTPDEERLLGSIFLGKVQNVLPGMQAAFVDIGRDKNAFLFINDALPSGKDHPENLRIGQLVHPGEEIIVQVIKDAFGDKGPRVTRRVTLPGRYLVLVPGATDVGVSRHIEDDAERDRLRDILRQVSPNGGFIVRTAARGVGEEEFRRDAEALKLEWESIEAAAQKSRPPAVLYEDRALSERILRDLLTPDVDRVVVDDPGQFDQLVQLAQDMAPALKERVVRHIGPAQLLKPYETDINHALRRKVWLTCGGYIVIDQAEALYAIDVNTGKFTGNCGLEETILRTNMEAAAEIARQIRLRNLGGIIIIDFIDMANPDDREQVLARLRELLETDRVRTRVVGMTELGLVEITRQKTRKSLMESVARVCPDCRGDGRVFTYQWIARQAVPGIISELRADTQEAALIEAHPGVNVALIGSDGRGVRRLRRETGHQLFFRGNPDRKPEQVEVVRTGSAAVLGPLAKNETNSANPTN